MDWDDHQDPSLKAVTRTVDLHTESWYNGKLRKLQSQRVNLTYEKMKPKEGPAESVGQKAKGSSRQQETVRSKKRALEVEKSKEHPKPPANRQNAAPSRESIIEARGQEDNTNEQEDMVEVSADFESSGYSDSTKYSPLPENQQGDDMVVTSEEEDGSIDTGGIC